ncbi:MAG: TGS domain-containing protein [Dehalococcoidia bacterium]|nr:TGS domain-containing protein [Dehalococcoidia bacterium]
MPANLTPQYHSAEKRYRDAKEVDEKIAALQEMMAVMPRHKGTDHLYAGLRAKVAKLGQESERKLATARRAGFYIRSEGAGQVVLVGPANVGKSQVLAMLTSASPEVAMYSYTTRTLLPGMMTFENIKIQLVDTPPLGHRDVRILLSSVLHGADVIAIVLDLGEDPVAQLDWTLTQLEECRVVPTSYDPQEKSETVIYRKKMLVIGNKLDLPGASRHLRDLEKRCDGLFQIAKVSATEGDELEWLPSEIFQSMDIIRVHTKAPGQKPDRSDPVILTKGSNVGQAATAIHKDIRKSLRYAVVWGSGKFEAQTVSKEHILQDGDIVEFHL